MRQLALNHLLIHRASNLILGSSPSLKHSTAIYKAVPVSEYVLEKYYAIISKQANGACLDAGEFAAISLSFLEALKSL